MGFFASLNETATEWCRGRFWPARLALLAFLGYVGVRHLADSKYTSIFGGLNLGIHEAGHLLFSWTGSEFFEAAGGTILQMAAPLIAAVLFLRQRDFFAVCVCGPWLATTMYDSASYIGDARRLALNLVTVGGGDAQHDWHYLLGRLGILPYDTMIATVVRIGAFVCMWGGVLLGAYLLLHMAFPESKKRKRAGPIVMTLRREARPEHDGRLDREEAPASWSEQESEALPRPSRREYVRHD